VCFVELHDVHADREQVLDVGVLLVDGFVVLLQTLQLLVLVGFGQTFILHPLSLGLGTLLQLDVHRLLVFV